MAGKLLSKAESSRRGSVDGFSVTRPVSKTLNGTQERSTHEQPIASGLDAPKRSHLQSLPGQFAQTDVAKMISIEHFPVLVCYIDPEWSEWWVKLPSKPL